MPTKRGFTVIELLVVVAVIAMISSFAFTSIQQTKAKSRDARREEDIKQMQTALDLYAVSFRRFPDCGANTVVVGAADGSDNCFSNALVSAGAISGLPADPLGGANGVSADCHTTAGIHVYCYTSFNGGASYILDYNLETATIPNKPQGWQIPASS